MKFIYINLLIFLIDYIRYIRFNVRERIELSMRDVLISAIGYKIFVTSNIKMISMFSGTHIRDTVTTKEENWRVF